MVQVFGTPVLIYQMGKVGSSSIFESLQNHALPGSIHHLHLLSKSKLEISKRQHLANNRKPPLEVEHGFAVRQFLDVHPEADVLVITAVREPVAQLVSTFFQTFEIKFSDLVFADGSWDTDQLIHELQQQIEQYDPANHWNCNWFDIDFLPALGIDIYEFPFDQESGSVVLEKANLKVLCLQLETNERWSDAIARFLGLANFSLKRSNDSKNKHYGSIYNETIASLSLSDESLDRIYSTKFARHFYTAEMLRRFKHRWTDIRRLNAVQQEV